MIDLKKQLAKRARWMEPIGQLLVLLGAGLQLFYLEPVKMQLNASEHEYTRSMIADSEQKIYTIIINGGKKMNEQQMAEFFAGQISSSYLSSERSYKNNFSKKVFSRWFAASFILGSLMVVVGKSASIWASS